MIDMLQKDKILLKNQKWSSEELINEIEPEIHGHDKVKNWKSQRLELYLTKNEKRLKNE